MFNFEQIVKNAYGKIPGATVTRNDDGELTVNLNLPPNDMYSIDSLYDDHYGDDKYSNLNELCMFNVRILGDIDDKLKNIQNQFKEQIVGIEDIYHTPDDNKWHTADIIIKKDHQDEFIKYLESIDFIHFNF